MGFFVDKAIQLSDLALGARGCVFTLHGVAEAQRWPHLPNRNFYVNIDFLDALLTYLRKCDWDIVTVEEAVRRISAPRISHKFVVFSFDDCYRHTYELAAPLFRRHGVPLTLFVTTGIPDATLQLHAAGLEDALMSRSEAQTDDGLIRLGDDESRARLYHKIFAQWDGPDAAAHYRRFCEANDIDIEAMHWKHAISWEMLQELARDPLVEIGGHTISHPHVGQLSHEDAVHEIGGGRRRLQEVLGIDPRHFAFPYGQPADCGPRDFKIALEQGFASAATTTKGLLRAGQDPSCLPRVNLNGAHQSFALIEAHLTGATSFTSRIKP